MKGYSFRSLTDLVLKIFKTKVNAGTGLSGGGSLEADRTLTVNYGTTAGTAAEGNDSRLSDSREWTGLTISQAEAEVGTATTRRAFTAQRVRQAIVAWWSSITGVFGRDLITSANNTVARDKLGLFTSALRWPTWAEVTSKPTTFTPSSHTHPWSQVTDQPVTATRWPSLAEVTGTPVNYPTTWDSVADKPAQATRWPSLAEVADKPTVYPTTWNSVAAKPAQATRWPTFVEVSGKPSTYTPNSHTHPTSQITGLDAALNTKAITSTQVIAGTGLTGGGTLAANRTLSIATSHIPIGVSQTWQRVTSSRDLGTTYTNTTGRTIVVSVTTNSKAGVYMDANVSGVVQFAHNSYTNQLLRPSVLLIVPAGNTYRVTSNSSLHTWAELR